MSSSKIIRSPPGSRPDSPAYVPETPVFTSGKPHPTPGIIIPRYVERFTIVSDSATDSETESEIESEIESESESEDEYANCPACRFERAHLSDIHVHSHRGCPFESDNEDEGVPGYDPTAPAYVPAPVPAPVWEQRSIVASMPGSGALLVARMRRISEEKRRDRMARRMQAFYRGYIKRIRKRIRKRKRDYEIAPPAKRFC